MLSATLKSLLARKVRLMLSGLAVMLGVMFVSGAFVLTDSLGRSFDQLFASAYSQTDVNVSAKPKVGAGADPTEIEAGPVPANLPANVVEAVRAVPGVAKATGVVAVDGARVVARNGKVVTSFGPPRLGKNWTGEDGLLEMREGQGPTADNEIGMNVALAEAAGYKVGDRVGVLTREPKREFTLVGIFGYSGGRPGLGGAQEVVFTTPVAQRLMLGEVGVYSNVDVAAAEGVELTVLRDRIGAALGSGYVVKTGEELTDDAAAAYKKGLQFFNDVLLGFAAVALFVGVFLIFNTFSIIVAQRTRELALLRAIGASRAQMIGSVVVEALVIGLFAAITGLAAGIGAGALLAFLFGEFADITLAELNVPASAVISAFVVGLLVTVVAATLPAVRASKVPPIAALREVATTDRPLTKVTVAGAIVTAVGAALLGVGLSGNVRDLGWVIFLGLIVCFGGVALLTPLISQPVVSGLGWVFSWFIAGKLGRLNSGRNPRRTAITAAALMVGIALVTAVTVVLDSAKDSVTALTKNTVQAEIFIAGDQGGSRPPSFDPAVLDEAVKLPGVRAAAGLFYDIAQVGGVRTHVQAGTDEAALASILSLKAVEGTVGALSPGQAMVDADTAKQLGLHAGSRVMLQLTRGQPRTYTISAVYAAYATTDLFGGFMLPEESAADFGVPQPVHGYVQLANDTAVSDVLPRIQQLLANNPEVSASDLSAFIAQQTSGADNVLQMIRILLTLAILIAVLGIVNTLVLSVMERTRELGLLRAIGFGRGQTMTMVTVEAVVISLFGALLGLIVGAGLGSVVVRALHDEGITSLVLPWNQMAAYLLLAAVIGVIAAVMPAVRAARLNVLAAISHD
jgi:putative ABC transport system permease protein